MVGNTIAYNMLRAKIEISRAKGRDVVGSESLWGCRFLFSVET